MNTLTPRRAASAYEISLTDALDLLPGGERIHTYRSAAQPRGRDVPRAEAIESIHLADGCWLCHVPDFGHQLRLGRSDHWLTVQVDPGRAKRLRDRLETLLTRAAKPLLDCSGRQRGECAGNARAPGRSGDLIGPGPAGS